MLLLAFLSLLPVSVLGHASCNPNVAVPNSYFMTSVRIPHGCDGSPVNNVTVMIPDGITSVKPKPVSGWTISITQRPMEPPITSHGRVINTTVDTISWSGNILSNEHFEDFPISMKLPNAEDSTILYFKVIQDCQNGSIGWIGIPGEGQNAEDYPAAKLTLRVNGTLLNEAQTSTSSAGSVISNLSIGLLTFLGLFAF